MTIGRVRCCELTPEIEAARRRWQFRGDVRPDFAHADAAHEESVWDYPRPPMIVPDTRLVQVFAEGSLIADSRDCVRVLETASPPAFYLPPDDVEWDALEATDVRTSVRMERHRDRVRRARRR